MFGNEGLECHLTPDVVPDIICLRTTIQRV